MITKIQGGVAQDYRGQIRFVNDFDMTLVKRFYTIKNANTLLTRGWRGHRIEHRWFYVISGTFKLSFVKIDDWTNPSSDLTIEDMIVTFNQEQVVYVPPGYGTAFRALEENSELLVFADQGIDSANKDNYIWDQDYFVNRS